MEELINHPVHISDRTSLAAFIPFCSIGDDLGGKMVGNFSDPVCYLFREKIVNGQVCYEADVNQYKKDIVNWEEALQKGFSFIIDTNDEYNVKNLMERKASSERNEKRKSHSTYRQTEEDNFFSILLRTISNTIFIQRQF